MTTPESKEKHCPACTSGYTARPLADLCVNCPCHQRPDKYFLPSHISNLELQNKRLLENNRTLQAKLREGNRAILNELLGSLPPNPAILETERDEGWNQCLHVVKRKITTLLSFQQEPQVKQPEG